MGKIKEAKEEAFELLDALTRAGAFPIEVCELHVVVAATHTFDKSLIDTVIEDNVNPIKKVERWSLIMAGTVHGKEASEMVSSANRPRLEASCPMLFGRQQAKEEEGSKEEM